MKAGPVRTTYKWYIISLVVLTNIFVVAMPAMGMSVLAKEISQDLHLNLVQIGFVWDMGPLPGILTSLLGGAIGDKVGPKRVLIKRGIPGASTVGLNKVSEQG